MSAVETESFGNYVNGVLREQCEEQAATLEFWLSLLDRLTNCGCVGTADWLIAEVPSASDRRGNIDAWIAGLASVTAIREIQRLREMEELIDG